MDDARERATVRAVFDAAVSAVHGRHCVRAALASSQWPARVHIVAVGKAASAMALGALDVLPRPLGRSLLVTKPGHVDAALRAESAFEIIEAGHPLLTEDSLRAGAALVELLERSDAGARFLFLISGGASSLVEVPAPGLTLGDLQRVNQWLLGSGWAIHDVNRIRKELSRIKGGKLLPYLRGRRAQVLLISDVPGDRLSDIGSGPLVAEPAEAMRVAPPDWLHTYLATAASMASPSAVTGSVPHRIVARLDDAKAAAVQSAERAGYRVYCSGEFLEGPAQDVGARLAADILGGPPGFYVWGGETTVVLPAHPGRGGRNQTLALSAASVIEGHQGIWLLAAGTDGSDGPGGDAGALVDGGTLARGAVAGLHAESCLSRADAGTLLAASGDLIHTGPTGTNVMDLVLALKSR